MANILATLGLEIDASGAIRNLRDVDQAADRTSRTMNELKGLARSLGLAFGAYQLVQWTRDTIALADAYTTMQSRLALVTHDAANLAQVQRDIFAVAQEARTPLESTALLYERLARVSGELGLAQSEVLRHTETINKAMVISGTSAEGTRAALVQLSQGFASGTLRGDELNAVLEQAPRLAQAIADGMGVSVGQLRRMGAEGKLTAQAVVDALEDQAGAIDREFEGMEMTVSGAMTRLRNSWMNYVGDANEASGATSGFAEAINSLADAIDPVGQKVNAFFGGFALMAVDAAVGWERLKASLVSGVPDWMLTAEGRANKAGAAATIAALDIYRQQEYDRITGGAGTDTRVYGAGLSGTAGSGTTQTAAEIREAERKEKAYRDLRQEMRYAAEDLNEEVRDLERSALARAYNTNALEHERRVRDIIANQAPQYREELIRESEALMAAANARDRRIETMEREEERLQRLVDAEHQAMEQLVARERERQEALERPFENAIENIQRSWGELFEGILQQGRVTADDLGAMFRRAGAELLAGLATARIQSAMAGMLGIGGMGGAAPVGDTAGLAGLGGTMNREALGGALAGGAVGFGVGYGMQDGGAGLLGGAMSGAAAGFMVGGPIGAAVGGLAGGLAGLVGGLMGASDAAERAREAQKSYALSLEAVEATLRGDDIALGIARIRAEMEQLRRQAEAAYGGNLWSEAKGGRNSTELERINALEAERIAQLRAEAALMQQHFREDLEVRALRAQGRDAEAAAMQMQLAQEREMEALRKEYMADDELSEQERLTLARLEEVHAMERTAQAIADLNRSAQNLPTHFKMAGYVFDALQEMTADEYRRRTTGGARPGVPPSEPYTPVQPGAPHGAGSGTDEPFVVAPVNLVLDGQVLARSTLKIFKRGASGPGNEPASVVLSHITVN